MSRRGKGGKGLGKLLAALHEISHKTNLYWVDRVVLCHPRRCADWDQGRLWVALVRSVLLHYSLGEVFYKRGTVLFIS